MKLKDILSETEYKGYVKAEILRLTTQEDWNGLLNFVKQEFGDIEFKTAFQQQDVPDFYKTGIKVDPNGTKRYKCHYICTDCGNRGTHYIYPDSEETYCHECQHHMEVRSMQSEYNVMRDSFKNYYYAGSYYPKELI